MEAKSIDKAIIFGNRRNALIAKCSDDRPLWTCGVMNAGGDPIAYYGLARTEKQFVDAVVQQVFYSVKKLSEKERSQAMAEELQADEKTDSR